MTLTLPAVTVDNVILWLHLVTAFLVGALLVALLVAAGGSERGGRGPASRLWRPLWWGFALVVVTGVWNTLFNPNTRPPLTEDLILRQPWAQSWRSIEHTLHTPYGVALYVKHVLIVALFLGLVAFGTSVARGRSRAASRWLVVDLLLFVLVLFSTALMVYTLH